MYNIHVHVCVHTHAYAPTKDKPVGLKNMWDSVVSWMKMAVDFIALDSPAEADPYGPPSPSRVSTSYHEPTYM